MLSPQEKSQESISVELQAPTIAISDVSYAKKTPGETPTLEKFPIKKMEEYLQSLKRLSPPDLPLLQELRPFLNDLVQKLQKTYVELTEKDYRFTVDWLYLGDHPNAFVMPGLNAIVFSYELLEACVQHATRSDGSTDMNLLGACLWEIIGHEMGHVHHGSFHHQDPEEEAKRNKSLKKWQKEAETIGFRDVVHFLEERSHGLTTESACDEFALQLGRKAGIPLEKLIEGLKVLKKCQETVKRQMLMKYHRQNVEKFGDEEVILIKDDSAYMGQRRVRKTDVLTSIEHDSAAALKMEYQYRSRVPSLLSTHPEVHWRIKQLETKALLMDLDQQEQSVAVPARNLAIPDPQKEAIGIEKYLEKQAIIALSTPCHTEKISDRQIILVQNLLNLALNIPIGALGQELFENQRFLPLGGLKNSADLFEICKAVRSEAKDPTDLLILQHCFQILRDQKQYNAILEDSFRIFILFNMICERSLRHSSDNENYHDSDEEREQIMKVVYYYDSLEGEVAPIDTVLRIIQKFPEELTLLIKSDLRKNWKFRENEIKQAAARLGVNLQDITAFLSKINILRLISKRKENPGLLEISDRFYNMVFEKMENRRGLIAVDPETLANVIRNAPFLAAQGAVIPRIVMQSQQMAECHRTLPKGEKLSYIDLQALLRLEIPAFQAAHQSIREDLKNLKSFEQWLASVPETPDLLEGTDGKTFGMAEYTLRSLHEEYLWRTLGEFTTKRLQALLKKDSDRSEAVLKLTTVIRKSPHRLAPMIHLQDLFKTVLEKVDNQENLITLGQRYHHILKASTDDHTSIANWKPIPPQSAGKMLFVPTGTSHAEIAKTWRDMSQFLESLTEPQLNTLVIREILSSWFFNLESNGKLPENFFLTLEINLALYFHDSTPRANQWLIQFYADQRGKDTKASSLPT